MDFGDRDNPASSRRTLWLGHEFMNEATRKNVKRVISSAVCLACMQAVSVLIGSMLDGFNPRALGGLLICLLIGLTLPACGFFGATQSSTPLMFCFCGCNWALMVVQFLLLVLLLNAIGGAQDLISDMCRESCKDVGCFNVGIYCSCSPSCNFGDTICCHDLSNVCSIAPPDDDFQELSCDELEQSLPFAMVSTVVFFLALMLPIMSATVIAAWHGSTLWQRLRVGDALVVSNSTVTLRGDPVHDSDGSAEELE
eukprot:TRINITY_DN46345_c0_g1_i1.p1 TRINITY_DN46345_c0_g1~~TRINITY_DN46345_c0_g1_i1.p1  ORF type:complete len:278 (+),score=36.31 TRINITY_DN46345_c0_g1_i1:74-835(+)